MILTCPNCSSRFLLSAEVLGEEGKKVKCATCQEVWHQDPDEEALLELRGDGGVADPGEPVEQSVEQSSESASDLLDHMYDEVGDDLDFGASDGAETGGAYDFYSEDSTEPESEFSPEPEGESFTPARDIYGDDIPDAIRPRSDRFSDEEQTSGLPPALKAFLGFIVGPSQSFKKRLGGYVLALLVFLAVSVPFLASPKQIIQRNPEMAALYRLLFMEPVIDGQGLIFDEVMAQIETDSLYLKGQILNLDLEERAVPDILVDVFNEYDEVIGRWKLDIPDEFVPGGQSLPFSSEYVGTQFQGGEVLMMKFLLGEPEPVEIVPIIRRDDHDEALVEEAQAEGRAHDGSDLPAEDDGPVYEDWVKDPQGGISLGEDIAEDAAPSAAPQPALTPLPLDHDAH